MRGSNYISWLENVKEGDQVALVPSRIVWGNRIRLLAVTRTTKTQIIVKIGSGHEVYNRSNGYARGSGTKLRYLAPVTPEILEEIAETNDRDRFASIMISNKTFNINVIRAMLAAYDEATKGAES